MNTYQCIICETVGPVSVITLNRPQVLNAMNRMLWVELADALKQVETDILEAGYQKGLNLAQDIPIASGVGFDLSEYPLEDEDRVGENTVLQISLALDSEQGFTAMLTDMLRIFENGGTWLNNISE